MEAKKNTAVKTVGMVMIIMLAGKMTGLLRDSFTAAYLGTKSVEANAFIYASSIPRNFLDFAFASAISSCFIPVFNSCIEKKGKKEASKLANNFITIILLLSILITAAAMVFSQQVVYIMGTKLDRETQLAASELLRILLPTIVLSAAAFSVTGILQSLGEFNIPAAMSVISNLLIISYFIFFFGRLGIYGLAGVYLIGWGTQVLIQIPSLIKKGYFYKPYIDLKDSGIREIAGLVIPVMLSAWILPINSAINLNAVAKLEQGGPTLTAANTLYSVITGILILSIANVIFPKLSKDIAQDNDEDFGETLRVTLRVLFFLLLPMMFGLIILGTPIVSVFYERGLFDAESTALTSTALAYYSLGMVGFGVQTILSRGFYANRDIKIPLLTGIVAIAVNAVLSFGLVDVIGVGGPALATSIAITITAVIMLYFMYRKNPVILNKRMVFDVLKMFIISLTMAAVVYLTMKILDAVFDGGSFAIKLVKLMCSTGIGVIWYMLLSYIAKIDEAKTVFSAISRVIERRKED